MLFGYCGTYVINTSNCSTANWSTSAYFESVSVAGKNIKVNTARWSQWDAGPFDTQVIIEFYITGLLIIFGIVANIISIVVLQKDKERKDVLFFLQALAFADAFYLAVAALRYPLKYLLPVVDNFVLIQPIVFPLLKTFQTIAIWTMVLVTVDRYTCVCHPLEAPRFFTPTARRRYAVAIFFSGFVYNLPRFFDSCVYRWMNFCSGFIFSRMLYRQTFTSPVYYNTYIDGLYMLLLYVGPLSTLTFMNVRLIQAIRYSRQRYQDRRLSSTRTWTPSNNSIGSTTTTGSDKNATIVLIIIVSVFIVCETPELVQKIISFADRNFSYDIFSRKLLVLNTISQLLMVVNSSANFLVYFTFGRRFRRILRETFRFSFKFNSNSTVVTHDVAVPVLQHYHHNCVHVHGGGGVQTHRL